MESVSIDLAKNLKPIPYTSKFQLHTHMSVKIQKTNFEVGKRPMSLIHY